MPKQKDRRKKSDLDFPRFRVHEAGYGRLRVTEDIEDAIFEDYDALLRYRYWKSPCQLTPSKCQPRKITHVVWDADDTIWDFTPAGAPWLDDALKDEYISITKGEDGATVRHPHIGTVQLKPELLRTLDALEKMGIESSIASINPPKSVEKMLKAFGIRDRFSKVISEFKPKANMVHDIAEALDLNTEEIMFVDDSVDNLHEVADTLGSLALGMGHDVMTPEDILEFIL